MYVLVMFSLSSKQGEKMNKRTTPTSTAFHRTFNHFVKFKFGIDTAKWSRWLVDEVGPESESRNEFYKSHWFIWGRNVGFMRSEDAMKFIEAAHVDLQDEWCRK